MNKIIRFLLAAALTLTLGACSGKPNTGSAGSSSGSVSAMEALPKDATPAQTVTADFTDKVNSGSYTTAEALAEALSTAEYLPFAGAFMPVEEGWLNGFTEEITGFKEAAMFGPAIGAIPFIGYVFVLEEGADVNAFLLKLNNAADPRWNICTSADETQSTAVGNKICFVMAPSTFEE